MIHHYTSVLDAAEQGAVFGLLFGLLALGIHSLPCMRRRKLRRRELRTHSITKAMWRAGHRPPQ